MPESALRHVVIGGASGLIGRALAESLRADGVRVTTLVRTPDQGADEVPWLVDSDVLDPAVLDGADAVIGLNGASIGRFPWSSSYKHTLLWSRVTPTRALARAVRELGEDAPHFVSASAVGYYGTDPGGPIAEDAPRGDGFLADLCGEWESAAYGAGDHARVATLRTAPIIHRDGVLKPLILLTKLGLSGPLGRGTQVWPWISLDDEVRAIRHIIDTGTTGPVNLSGPTRATANDIGFALARELNRPYLLRAPEWGLKLVLGSDPTESLLTTDAYVIPEVLAASGFSWTHESAEEAVRAAIGRR
ncbi:TIGR01777 family oxidoreductase [Microbacterium sp.]|uniref:TIGR01777 family oxidoreductase n=1 Tax=Microbacterium sp. TaxID=51671 RepID=UPI002625ACC0|nr:TIGR01777 family oxidoreductase [Microbacterium sp.]